MPSEPDHVHETVLEFEYDDPDRAALVARSVRCEVDEISDDRTAATVTHSDRTVTVGVTAADPVALRAGLNTWGSLVEVAERTAAVGR